MMDNLDDIKIEIAEPIKPIPEGVYNVKITNINKKKAINTVTKMEETRLSFEFTILDGSEKDHKLFRSVTPKLAFEPKMSNLYQIWAAVAGKNPKALEFPNFHLSPLIGKTLKVVVAQVEKNDVVYSNITSYLKNSVVEESKPATEEEVDELFGDESEEVE
jgi:hypothetical protein